MKKFVFTLLLVFVCHLGYAQGINGLFNEFGSEKNADCVKVPSFMMSLGKMFAGHDEDAEIIRKIKSIKVLDLESCTASVKERFNKKVNKLNLKGYDELMRVNDEGEKVRVLMKTKKETIRELLFVCTGKEDCTLVQINGKFGAPAGGQNLRTCRSRRPCRTAPPLRPPLTAAGALWSTGAPPASGQTSRRCSPRRSPSPPRSASAARS